MRRDRFTCQICGQVGGQLQVDHFPKTFSEIIKQHGIKSLEDAIACQDLWDETNNRTLCKPCHMKTDTYLKGKRTAKI